jgi:hypothetical protein
MGIEFQCDECGKLLNVDTEPGATVVCPHCSEAVIVPAGLASLPQPQIQGGPPPAPSQYAVAPQAVGWASLTINRALPAAGAKARATCTASATGLTPKSSAASRHGSLQSRPSAIRHRRPVAAARRCRWRASASSSLAPPSTKSICPCPLLTKPSISVSGLWAPVISAAISAVRELGFSALARAMVHPLRRPGSSKKGVVVGPTNTVSARVWDIQASGRVS